MTSVADRGLLVGRGLSGDGLVLAVNGYFSYPVGVVLDANRNLFVADASCGAIREFLFNGSSYGTKPTLLGSGLREPQGVTLDANGNLFIADSANGRILVMAATAHRPR